MRNSKFSVSFFTIVLWITNIASSSMAASCANDEGPTVQFPFSFDLDQQESGAYPGFNLSCRYMNQVVLQLGQWANFAVRDINYVTQEVGIYDQHNCLPERLLTLNLSGSPFQGVYYQNYTFLNCSAELSTSSYPLRPISCLSTSSHKMFATSSSSFAGDMSTACNLFASAMVPIPRLAYRLGYSTDINDDLHLKWDAPNCGDCYAEGGHCGFKNREKNEIGCFNLHRNGLSVGAKYVLVFGVGIPFLLCASAIVCCRYAKLYSAGNDDPQHIRHAESSMPGLDETIIQSYPNTVLGESRRLVKPEDNICPICLSEYRAKEILKTIPDCKHCFHAACIDQWLRRNITCPLCRNAPVLLPPLV